MSSAVILVGLLDREFREGGAALRRRSCRLPMFQLLAIAKAAADGDSKAVDLSPQVSTVYNREWESNFVVSGYCGWVADEAQASHVRDRAGPRQNRHSHGRVRCVRTGSFRTSVQTFSFFTASLVVNAAKKSHDRRAKVVHVKHGLSERGSGSLRVWSTHPTSTQGY